MLWNEAFKLMKEGNKIKLPSWGGYWYWDNKKETIMMQCRPQDADKGQGAIIDIREQYLETCKPLKERFFVRIDK